MKQRRSISMIASIVLAAAIGCGGNSPSPAAPGAPDEHAQVAQAAPHGDISQVGAGEDEDDSTAELAEHHRHHHHGGFAMFIAMSLDSLGVAPEQHDAIMKIQADLHAKSQPAHDAERAVLLALADDVAAGQVDQAKLGPAIAQLSAASANVHDAVADSLNALHAVLTAPQRQGLVDKVGAHFEVWHHANSPEVTSSKDARGGHLAQLAQDLGLSADQVEQIRASYSDAIAKASHYDRAEADAHFKAFSAAFTSDHFDAKALTNGGAVNAHMATWGITRLVLFYKAAAPVLTPEQRTNAADDLRRNANYKRSDTET